MKRKFILGITFLMTIVVLFVGHSSAFATNGGVVQTKGRITFYEESASTEPTSSASTEPTSSASTEPTSSASTEPTSSASTEPFDSGSVGKPIVLPSTGEMVRAGFVIGGLGLIVSGLFFLYRKRRKNEEGENR
ncbi:LPXTG cell wall anchor domain-containing protein [Enterococcus termitis]